MSAKTSIRLKDPRVLIVDDDAKIMRFISISLKLVGYEVIAAASGEEALKLAESENPDIMLLDIFMPEMDGFEVLERLRTSSKIPVIAISAHSSIAEKALNLGASDFLAKPFRPDELVKKIRSLLSVT